MSAPKKPHLPIGYWLKKADEVLTSRINAAQEANGLTRTEWQILNVLHETSSASRSQIIELLSPFRDADALGSTIDALIDRGLVEATETETRQLRLTAQGRDLHATALAVQKKIRQQAVQGIREADYGTTIQVLQQIVNNLTAEDRHGTG